MSTQLAQRLLRALGLPEAVQSFTLVLDHRSLRATVRPAVPAPGIAQEQRFELVSTAPKGAHWPLVNALCRELGLPESVSRLELRFAAGAISELIVDMPLLADVDVDDLEQACTGLQLAALVPVEQRETEQALSAGQRAFMKGALSSIR